MRQSPRQNLRRSSSSSMTFSKKDWRRSPPARSTRARSAQSACWVNAAGRSTAGNPRWHTPDGRDTMTTISGLRLDDLQKEYSDLLLSVLTVLLLIMLFVVAPFHAPGIKMFEAFGAVVALVMVAGVFV